jgi:hypothetical protein
MLQQGVEVVATTVGDEATVMSRRGPVEAAVDRAVHGQRGLDEGRRGVESARRRGRKRAQGRRSRRDR